VPSQITLTIGQTVILSVIAYDGAGEPVPGVDFLWRMKDSRAGTVDGAGILTAGSIPGLYPNTVEVVATQETENGTSTLLAEATINVIVGSDQRFLHSIGVYPPDVNVQAGQFIGLGALGWDAQGRLIPGLQFRWSIEDTRVGSIEEFGFFTASEATGSYPNSVRVTAIQSIPQGDVVRVAFVSVRIGEETETGLLKNVVITPEQAFLEAGEEVTFLAHAFDGNGRRLSNVSFEWSVSNPSLGSINANGKLTSGSFIDRVGAARVIAQFPDSVQVSARYPDSVGLIARYPDSVRVIATQTLLDGVATAEETASVTVTEPRPPPEILSTAYILPSSIALNPGQRFIFLVTTFDPEWKRIIEVETTWGMLDLRAGSIDQIGIITAGWESGIYTDAVRVQVVEGEGADSQVAVAYATIGIIGELNSVEIQPRRVTLRPGQSILLDVKGSDVNGLGIAPLRNSWAVVDPVAGTVDAAGLFTAGNQPGEYVNAIKVVVTERGD
jgi:hypothetical protein